MKFTVFFHFANTDDSGDSGQGGQVVEALIEGDSAEQVTHKIASDLHGNGFFVYEEDGNFKAISVTALRRFFVHGEGE